MTLINLIIYDITRDAFKSTRLLHKEKPVLNVIAEALYKLFNNNALRHRKGSFCYLLFSLLLRKGQGHFHVEYKKCLYS